MPEDLEILACELTGELRKYVREAREQRAYLDVGEPAPELSAMFAAVRAEVDAIERGYRAATGPHVHHWSDDDYCTICGMDGRS